MATADNSLE